MKNEILDEEPMLSKGLTFAVQSQSISRITVPIDEPIIEPRYYREVCHVIANASEHDQIEFEISSPGGNLDGLQVLLTSLEKTQATSVAYINGPCHSAASILALNCDTVYVSPHASMLVHFVSYGAVGKAVDIALKVDHVQKISQTLFQSTYKGFLTPEEIKQCMHGYELWLDANDIRKRLDRKTKELEEKPRTKTRTKSKPKLEVSEE